jgi:hypothetical protein
MSEYKFDDDFYIEQLGFFTHDTKYNSDEDLYYNYSEDGTLLTIEKIKDTRERAYSTIKYPIVESIENNVMLLGLVLAGISGIIGLLESKSLLGIVYGIGWFYILAWFFIALPYEFIKDKFLTDKEVKTIVDNEYTYINRKFINELL